MAEDLRPLPAERQEICARCHRRIVFAVTVAGPNGRGGKAMPLEPIEDLAGNVAVRPTNTHGGRLLARVLMKGETVDRPLEFAGMPHFASCEPVPAQESPYL